MKLAALTRGETWMTPEEAELNAGFIQGIGKLLQARGVAENPLLVLRVNDVVISWLLTRRLEEALSEEAPEATPNATQTTPARADAIGKSRERLRKSIKDLEDYCARAGTPIDTGIADVMKPVIQQVQGGKPFFEGNGEKAKRTQTT